MQNIGRFRNSYAEIHLSQVRNNFSVLKRRAGDSVFFCPMVKGNAYGHGDVEVARVCQDMGADAVGVALIEEGIHLRQNQVTCPILLFGFFDSIGAEQIVNYQLTPVISNWDEINFLSKHLAEGAQFSVHLKFNTGMNRLGFEVSEVKNLLKYFSSQTKMNLEGVATHLLKARDIRQPDGHTQAQLENFQGVLHEVSRLGLKIHYLNSSALFEIENSLGVGARPGISLYGADPHALSFKSELRPVMAVKTHLSQIRDVKRGESVSYEAQWVAKRDSKIGVIPLGYADGYPRILSNKGFMSIRGQVVPIVGIVCMDYIMLDLTEALAKDPSIDTSSSVLVLGEDGADQVPAQKIAELASTITYEIFAGFTSRLPRVYIK